jgi:hypothetical protein
MPGSQDYAADPRNDAVRIYVNGVLVPRGEAKVSLFDAGFVLGDGIWEGLRLHRGGLLFLDAHMDRLFEGARAIALDIGRSRAEVETALRHTLAANGMADGVHIRLMVTRGEKKTPNQDPRNALGRPTIAIVAEYKEPSPLIVTKGLRLFTSAIRCTPADMFDMRLNSHSRLNLIIALTQPVRIAMWSGPRNISTAMMRAFENRPDTGVSDEPFYAAYLVATGLDHPMRDEVMAAQPNGLARCRAAWSGRPRGRPIWYQKHMTHHMLPGFGRDWIAQCRNAFLIRAPEAVLASYSVKRREVMLADIGFVEQRDCSIGSPTGWAGRLSSLTPMRCSPIPGAR